MSDLDHAPRWFLRLLAGAAVAAAVGWAAHVEAHINASSNGFQRIAALEAQVAVLQSHAAWCRLQHAKGPGGSE